MWSITVEGGKIVSHEKRDKMGHNQFSGEHARGSAWSRPARGHGFDTAAQDRHARMATAIGDCEVLLARGMGAGAYESMKQANIRPVVTDVADIDQAVQAIWQAT